MSDEEKQEAETQGHMSESEEDAALAAIMNEAGEVEDDDFMDEPEGSGETDVRQQGQEKDDEEDRVDGDGQDQGQEEDDQEDYAQALAQLTKAGWSTADIMALDRDVAIRTGKIMSVQDALDKPTEEASPDRDAQEPAFDASDLAEKLEDALGEEASKALMVALQALAAPRDNSDIEQMKSSITGLRDMYVEAQSDANRQKLMGEYPSLEDDGVYSRVRERMELLAKSGEYTDVGPLMQHACMIEIPAEERAGAQQARRTKKRSGQPSRPGRTSRTNNGSPESKEDAVLRKLFDPNRKQSADDIRREIYG